MTLYAQAKENADELLQEKAALEKSKKELIDSATLKEADLKKKLNTVGNIVHDSVPVSNDEANNAIIRTWAPEGVTVEKKDCLSHHEVLTRIDGYDPERGVKVVGHRGYFLKQWGTFLNQALINYGLEYLMLRGYTALQAPQFMLKDMMAKTAQLSDFDEELYKVSDGPPQNDKYLIATSEQPISAFHADEWLLKTDLPLKYAGYSSCYRREAGAHGRDAWGIFRVHEFTKVEQFILTDPEKSWEMFDDMISVSEGFYQSLGLPYQIVAIVSGALNNAAAKKFDLEAWFPFQGEFKELVSCSNCTDYQSRNLEIRFGSKKQTDIKKTYVHCLNSTLCATTRALCCILENYQTEDVSFTALLFFFIITSCSLISIAYSNLTLGSASTRASAEVPARSARLHPVHQGAPQGLYLPEGEGQEGQGGSQAEGGCLGCSGCGGRCCRDGGREAEGCLCLNWRPGPSSQKCWGIDLSLELGRPGVK